MVEESIHTFETYCKYVDAASLTADKERTRQYLDIMKQYVNYAACPPTTSRGLTTPSSATIQWRMVALRATRAVVGSDALAVDTQAQLEIVMPVVLNNLQLEEGVPLDQLQRRAQTGEKLSSEMARKRRASSAAVPPIERPETDPALAAETTAAADQAAEEEIRVLAIRCLQQMFSVSSGSGRAQLRIATSLILKFVATEERPGPSTRSGLNTSRGPGWATTLFETVARWTPVQDRFIIIIVAVETLVRTPTVEHFLHQQLILASLTEWLLRSDINLIGLSVMDVLLRLVQHTLVLLQLGSRGAKVQLVQDGQTSLDIASSTVEPARMTIPNAKEKRASPTRRDLLSILEKCISGLATHIYYTDQISDMMTAIMARLKPSTFSSEATAAAAVDDPVAAQRTIVEGANLQEDPTTDGFFSFATARVLALKAVKDILITANTRRTSSGASAEVRSRVGVNVWDGTQWLLKDEDFDVRSAYVDAIVTWLKFETNKSDLLLPRDGIRHPKAPKKDRAPGGEILPSKRVISSAAKKEPRPVKSSFLQLLHLAVYDNAVSRADSTHDILLLFLLLWTLVDRLGVNAVRTGLPMMMDLQNFVLNSSPDTPYAAKARIGSLVHGYLWAICHKFDLEDTPAGHEINAEVARRKRYACWCGSITFPPAPAAQIAVRPTTVDEGLSAPGVDTMKPFLNVRMLVDEIAQSYDRSLISPPSSPPTSPGRVFSIPTLGFGYGYSVPPAPRPSPQTGQMPQKVKDEMCGQWSREACMAAVEKESNPSITGSRAAASSTGRQHLSVNNVHGHSSGRETPENVSPVDPPKPAGLGGLVRVRGTSATSSMRDFETSSRDSTMRVADLKRVLRGTNDEFRGLSPLRRPLTRSRTSTHSSVEESMLSWNASEDDLEVAPQSRGTMRSAMARAIRRDIRPLTPVRPEPSIPSNGRLTYDQVTINPGQIDADVPPVPPLPLSVNSQMAGAFPVTREVSPTRVEDHVLIRNSSSLTAIPRHDKSVQQRSRPTSRAGTASVWSAAPSTRIVKADVNALLASIHIETAGPGIKAGDGPKVIKPPY